MGFQPSKMAPSNLCKHSLANTLDGKKPIGNIFLGEASCISLK